MLVWTFLLKQGLNQVNLSFSVPAVIREASGAANVEESNVVLYPLDFKGFSWMGFNLLKTSSLQESSEIRY